MIAEFHSKAPRGLDAGVGNHADQDDLLDTMLLELRIEIGVGEAALCPMFVDDDVPLLRSEFRIKLAAPAAGLEDSRMKRAHLRRVHMLPSVEVTFVSPVVWYDEYLDTCGSNRRKQFAEVIEQARRLRRLLDQFVQFAALAHEIVVGVDNEEGGMIGAIVCCGHDK